MKTALQVPGDIAERGDKIYKEKLRQLLEPAHSGEVVVINVDTGEYEVDKAHIAALQRARARWPDVVFFAARVGFPAMGRIRPRPAIKSE